ncbi:hypothetical protein Hanom_Chr03g00261081 [Helianthus anomalus]
MNSYKVSIFYSFCCYPSIPSILGLELRKTLVMESPYQEKVEVEAQAQTFPVESWVKTKNLVLTVGGADIQEKVTGMVIEEITSLSNQMAMAEETETLVMVTEVVDRSFVVMVTVAAVRSFLVREVEAEVGRRTSEVMEVAAVTGMEAIQMIAVVVDLASEFDFELEDFADTADERVG